MEEEKKEWLILFALFKAAVEQKSMVLGKTRHKEKMLFNRWAKEGVKFFRHIESQYDDENYVIEQACELIEDAVDKIRKDGQERG